MKAIAQNRQKQQYSADQTMLEVARSLIRDFQTDLNDPLFCKDLLEAINTGDIARIRESIPANDLDADASRFKAIYQIQSLLKRYRFEIDLYSDDELEEKATKLFLETQSRIRSINLDAVDAFTTDVLEYARIYLANLLGKYSDEEHRKLCRFGTKASVGIPARSACLAARWELPLSGSLEQIDWFDAEMRQVQHVQDYWSMQKSLGLERPTYQSVSSLKLTLVPKSYKSLRAIMPNTTIGSYMSFGLGEMMRKRLLRRGYDIRELQMTHRVLARKASVHNKYTTADLSSASDSISVALVAKLFPPDWYSILCQSRIGHVLLPNNTLVESNTFSTMGIGYTFPMQTLVFLALLRAIEAKLFNRWGRVLISVYGDDMIYSSKLHQSVEHVFGQIGFVLNVDKTFSDGPFRESCGGDFYRGVDVRPFQPQNGQAIMGSKPYEAMLYKFINTLLVRWSEYEIERTLAFLVSEIERVTGKCKLVPYDYPDDAGVKVTLHHHTWSFLQSAAVARPVSIGHGVFRFSYLRFVPEVRKEDRHEPYYWAALSGNHPVTVDYSGRCCDGAAPDFFPKLALAFKEIREYVPLLLEREVEPIKTRKRREFKPYTLKVTTRRYRRISTYVVISHTGRYKRQSGTSCFEVRR